MLLRPLHGLVRRAIAPLVVRLVAPPERGPRHERDGVATDVNRVALDVSRRPLRAIDLPRDGAADVPEGKDDAERCSALVRPRDIAPEPRPAHGDRDEPVHALVGSSGGEDEEAYMNMTKKNMT